MTRDVFFFFLGKDTLCYQRSWHGVSWLLIIVGSFLVESYWLFMTL